MPSFSLTARQQQQALWQNCIRHPFVAALANGQLPLAQFRHYLLQDSHYLKQFALLQQRTAHQLTLPADCRLLLRHADATLESELAMHDEFGTQLTISEAEYATVTPQPATQAYLNHLQHTICLSIPAFSMAALLPCYWLYLDIGHHLLQQPPSPQPLYARWIATYASDWFHTLLHEAQTLTDRLADDLNPNQRRQAEQIFQTSCQHEWHFWQAAWQADPMPA